MMPNYLCRPLRKLRLGILFVLVLLIVAISPVVLRAQFLHPKVTSKQTAIRNIVVLPAKVNVFRDSMKGPEGMAAESEDISGRVEKMVAEVLGKQKSVTTMSATEKPSADDAQAKYTVADIQTKFDDLLPKV